MAVHLSLFDSPAGCQYEMCFQAASKQFVLLLATCVTDGKLVCLLPHEIGFAALGVLKEPISCSLTTENIQGMSFISRKALREMNTKSMKAWSDADSAVQHHLLRVPMWENACVVPDLTGTNKTASRLFGLDELKTWIVHALGLGPNVRPKFNTSALDSSSEPLAKRSRTFGFDAKSFHEGRAKGVVLDVCSEQPSTECDEKKHCYLPDVLLKTSAKLVAAASLSIGDKVIDYKGHETEVLWCRIQRKEKRLLVAMQTKYSMLTVTGSHRVVVPEGRVTRARELSRDDMVVVAHGQLEPLKNVTKSYGCVSVVELEFAGDAVVEAYPQSILRKGSDPSLPMDESGGMKCKQEGDEVLPSGNSVSCAHVHATEQTVIWPDTEDGF